MLELILDDQESKPLVIILIGEGDLPKNVEKAQVKILWLADLEREGASGDSLEPVTVGMIPP